MPPDALYPAITVRDELALGGKAADRLPRSVPRPARKSRAYFYTAAQVRQLALFACLWRLGVPADQAAEATELYQVAAERGQGWLLAAPGAGDGRWRIDLARDNADLLDRLGSARRGALVLSLTAVQLAAEMACRMSASKTPE